MEFTILRHLWRKHDAYLLTDDPLHPIEIGNTTIIDRRDVDTRPSVLLPACDGRSWCPLFFAGCAGRMRRLGSTIVVEATNRFAASDSCYSIGMHSED